MIDKVWIDLADAIRQQLALQVELSTERHHAFMLKSGLDKCRDFVDVGTGNGLFLSKLTSKHPDISFHGVDDKPHMVDEAKTNSTVMPNVEWHQADALDPQTARLLNATDGILMRYFLLHMPDTCASLQQMLSGVKIGTRLWVFDLDTDHCRCEPPDPAFDKFVELVQKFCDTKGVKIRTSALLPPILESCGFKVEDVSVEPFNNHEIGTEIFSDYLLREAYLYHYTLYGTPGTEELAPLREFLCQQASKQSYFVQYGMVMVNAVKVQ